MTEQLIRECCELPFSDKRILIDRLLLSIKEGRKMLPEITSVTYEMVINAMCRAMGWTHIPTDDHTAIVCLAKKIIYYTMADEGETPYTIARYFNVAPSTIYHHIDAFRIILANPKMNKGAIKIYNQFKQELYETER